MNRPWSTVYDRIRELKLSPGDDLVTLSGKQAWKEYGQATGELPRQVSRSKTFGSGTHVLASYPEWFLARLDRIILDFAEEIYAEQEAQGVLFNHDN